MHGIRKYNRLISQYIILLWLRLVSFFFLFRQGARFFCWTRISRALLTMCHPGSRPPRLSWRRTLRADISRVSFPGRSQRNPDRCRNEATLYIVDPRRVLIRGAIRHGRKFASLVVDGTPCRASPCLP
ncbi:hypothetical protein GGR50DRAFT_646879 [Xylaria sp. CBS 124048]|nr:hypothetical protein GGR50DRAFT_646879 [Xylaria sp. CBS 124048]